jgi:hypothetical protein
MSTSPSLGHQPRLPLRIANTERTATSGGRNALSVSSFLDVARPPMSGKRRHATVHNAPRAGDLGHSTGQNPYGSGTRHTLTCEGLSPVKGERSHQAHRCSSVMPAIRAIRSSSAGHTYRNGAVNSRKLSSAFR